MFTLGQKVTTPKGTGSIFGIGRSGSVEGEVIVRLTGGGMARFSGSGLYRVEVA